VNKHKKFFALILTCMLLFNGGIPSFSAGLILNGDFVGDGKVIYDVLDDEVFKYWVPTNLSYDFMLIPQQLLGGPAVIFNPNSTLLIVSESSVPVSVDVTFKMFDNGDINFVDDAALLDVPLNSEYRKDLLIELETTKESVSAIGSFVGGGIKGATNKRGTMFKYVLDEASYSYLVTVIDADNYVYQFDFVRDDPTEAYGIQLKPSGQIGAMGNWNTYVGAAPSHFVTMEVKYVVDIYSDDIAAVNYLDPPNAYALVEIDQDFSYPVDFEFNGSIVLFTIKADPLYGSIFSSVKTEYTIYKDGDAGTEIFGTTNLSGLTVMNNGSTAMFAIPYWIANDGWTKLVITGDGVSGKTITMVKAGPANQRGAVLVSIKD